MSEGAKHSLLSPSSSSRWMNCPPSARLTEDYPDKGSAFAAEGTLAHSWAEHKLKLRLMPGSVDKLKRCDDHEMDDHTDDYVDFVLEQRARLKDPAVFIEQRVDCSRYVPECKGTCDTVIVSDGVLHIIDLKYGRGVKVDATGNQQLMIYALGALEMFGFLYPVETVRISIFQPRLDNCSTWEVPADDLEAWGEDVLKPAAKMAWDGEGELRAGDHCKFCKAKAQCRERARANLMLAAYDFQDPHLLDEIEVSAILEKVDELVAWASDIKDFALTQATKGVRYEGWKVVAGRSNRKYTDSEAVAGKVKEIGLDPYEHKVLGITAMTALLGKKRFAEVLGGMIEKPDGKPVLVPEADSRKELNTNTAADDFADPIEN